MHYSKLCKIFVGIFTYITVKLDYLFFFFFEAQSELDTTNRPVSQCSPMYPAAQVHSKWLTRSVHTPPFKHGADSHSLISKHLGHGSFKFVVFYLQIIKRAGCQCESATNYLFRSVLRCIHLHTDTHTTCLCPLLDHHSHNTTPNENSHPRLKANTNITCPLDANNITICVSN